METIDCRTVCAKLPTVNGEFRVMVFNNGGEHVALVKGGVKGRKNVLVRVHSECFTGDVLASLRCDCGPQLKESMRLIGREGGVLIYLRQEGRGIGLTKKVLAYRLQDEMGLDTVEANKAIGEAADSRDYLPAAEILKSLGVKSVRLLTNNPLKISDLKEHGVQISQRIPLVIKPNEHNRKYLATKRKKLHHLIPVVK